MKHASPPTLWLVGYGAWPVAKRAAGLVASLQSRAITRLLDVRISPCSSDLEPSRPYGPRPWNLQTPGQGIAALMNEAGIAYEWIVELGNPQRHDPEMAILRAQIADRSHPWPVHRGLNYLAHLLRESNQPSALLCACADGAGCHRTVIAQALNESYFRGSLLIREVRE